MTPGKPYPSFLVHPLKLNEQYIRIANRYALLGSVESMIIVEGLFRDRVVLFQESKSHMKASTFEEQMKNAQNAVVRASKKVQEFKVLQGGVDRSNLECECLQQIDAHVKEFHRMFPLFPPEA